MGNYESEPTFGGIINELSKRIAALELTTGRARFLNIPTAQTRNATTYGVLDTPDQHENVSCPANSLLTVAYQATWQESVNGAAKAALFIGNTQTQTRQIPTPTNSYTFISYAGVGDPPARDTILSTATTGLVSTQLPTGQSYSGPDPTFGHLQEFSVPISTAGLYTVSVRFLATSGTVTVKNRSLWVWGG